MLFSNISASKSKLVQNILKQKSENSTQSNPNTNHSDTTCIWFFHKKVKRESVMHSGGLEGKQWDLNQRFNV